MHYPVKPRGMRVYQGESLRTDHREVPVKPRGTRVYQGESLLRIPVFVYPEVKSLDHTVTVSFF